MRLRSFSFPGLLLIGLLLVGGHRAAALDEPWQDAALLLFNTASPELNQLRAKGKGDGRLADYADALILLHKPKASDEEIEQAKTVLQDLATGRLDDDIAAASEYYLIRILQNHQKDPKPGEAREKYKELFLARPKHFFGQLAFLKFAFSEIYESESAMPVPERLIYLQDLGEGFEIPDTKRGFHRILGEAYLNFDLSREKAFEHLKAAYEIGYPMATAQIDAGLELVELAEELGKTDYAVTVCNELLATYAYDPRRPEIESMRDRLANQ